MKKWSLLIPVLGILSCSGQNESAKNELADKLVHYYNQKTYDSIFFLFSPEMKDALPLQKTREFFSQLQRDAGRIIKHEYKEQKMTANQYRTDFENLVMWMSVSEDANGTINGLYFNEYDGKDVEVATQRNSTTMMLPFKEEWFVFWGGDTKAQNYHVISRAQKNAFDLVIMDEKGKSYKTNGKTNEDYYAFGKELIAPCDAEVVTVIDGVDDNTPGQMNQDQITGNTVVLKTEANEYLLFAHFKLNSITVAKGDKVKKGQLLGLCGNSGNSSEPHLHFHIQDKESMMGATGIKCHFETIKVNGVEKNDYSPVKGERVSNK